jgi:hypothetical protein
VVNRAPGPLPTDSSSRILPTLQPHSLRPTGSDVLRPVKGPSTRVQFSVRIYDSMSDLHTKGLDSLSDTNYNCLSTHIRENKSKNQLLAPSAGNLSRNRTAFHTHNCVFRQPLSPCLSLHFRPILSIHLDRINTHQSHVIIIIMS